MHLKHSFKLVSRKSIKKDNALSLPVEKEFKKEDTSVVDSANISVIDSSNTSNKVDDNKRLFLKMAGIAGLGVLASSVFPKGAEAYVTGSTPTSNVVGVKNVANTKINPATQEGQGVSKLSINLSSSGNVLVPGTGNKIRVYASRFSLTADATSVSFRFTSGGTDHEKYVSPKTGGLYGANNHPNYIEGGVDEVLYCVISGTTTVQINIDYLEV